eukprot:bmy_06880T0
MAVSRPCAEGPCCSRPSAAPGVQQTLDEMDFERADPSQPDSAGYTALTHGGATALHRASYCGHTDIARLLLSHGSNPRLVDDDGMTSLHKAAEKGHVDICSLLLQHSPALKAVRDRKARLACDLLPCNSDLRDLLAS